MRHQKQRFSLNRFSSYRKATVKELARSVLTHQRIITTEKKAKAARPMIEKIISLAKKGDLYSRRKVYDLLGSHSLVKHIFSILAPLFSKRQSGFTRIIFWKKRRGDNAQIVILELTEKKEIEKKKKSEPVQKTDEQPKEKKQVGGEKPVAGDKKKFLGGFKALFKKKRHSNKQDS